MRKKILMSYAIAIQFILSIADIKVVNAFTEGDGTGSVNPNINALNDLAKKTVNLNDLPGWNGDVFALANKLIRFMAYLAPVLAITLFAYFAFRAIQGTDEQRQKFIKYIQYSALGLVILFLSYLIVTGVLKVLFSL